MPDVPTRRSVGARLLGGFTISSVAFVAACVVCHLHLRRHGEDLVKIRRLGDGVRASLQMASAARDMYMHQAHVIIEGLSHVEHYEEAMEDLERWREVAAAHVATDDEREALAGMKASVSELDQIFTSGIIPAAREGRTDDTRRLHEEADRVVQAIVGDNDRLIESFRLRIGDAQTNAARQTAAVFARSAALLVAAVLLSGAIAFLTARSVTRPVARLVELTDAVAAGDLDRRAEVTGHDELSRLSERFNRMVGELAKNQRDLIQAEKLASLGRLAAGVAHEINNPLGIILGYAKTMLAERREDASDRDDLQSIVEEAEQCHKIVLDLVAFARPVARTDEVCSLAEVVEEEAGRIEGLVRPPADPPALELDLADPSPAVPMERRLLKQLIANLIRNAIDAMPDGGRLGISVRSDHADGPRAVLSIRDTGCGMNDEQRDRIFEPFFTTKPRGTGLGLAICWGIVEGVGGRVDVETAPGEGTTITVTLPASSSREEEIG